MRAKDTTHAIIAQAPPTRSARAWNVIPPSQSATSSTISGQSLQIYPRREGPTHLFRPLWYCTLASPWWLRDKVKMAKSAGGLLTEWTYFLFLLPFILSGSTGERRHQISTKEEILKKQLFPYGVWKVKNWRSLGWLCYNLSGLENRLIFLGIIGCRKA